MSKLTINEVINLSYFDLVDSPVGKLSVGEWMITEAGDVYVMLKQGAIKISSTTQTAIPALTTAERLALTPIAPTEVYDTDEGYYYWWNVNTGEWEAKATVSP